MKKLDKCLYFLILYWCLIGLIGCGNSPLEIFGEVSLPSDTNTADKSWDFSTASDYTFDSEFIGFSAGSVSLKSVNQSFSSANFAEGTLSGVSTVNSKLTLDAATATVRSLNTVWTPEFSSLVAHWQMDGDFQDTQGTHNGIATNGATFDPNAKVGSNSGFFDGIDDFVDVAESDLLDPTTLTITAWINFSTTTNNGNIVNKGDDFGYRLRVNSSDQLEFLDRGATNQLTGTTTLHAGVWHHVAVTGSSTGIKIYLDGVLEASNATAYGSPNTANNLQIGLGNVTEFFDGLIDEVGIWSVALDSAEIAKIYDRQKQKYSGHFESPIIKAGSAVSWPNLQWKTELPFLKALTGQSGNELTADYSSLVDQTGTSGNSNLSTGLIAHWSFDGTAGSIAPSTTISDLSGLSNDATSFNSVTRVQGILGQGFHGEGLNGGLKANTIVDDLNSNEGTVAFWFNRYFPDGDNTTLRVVFEAYESSNNRINFLYHTACDCFVFTHRGNAVTAAVSVVESVLPQGEWHHVTMSWSIANDQVRLFVDGVEAPASPVNGLTALTLAPAGVGLMVDAFVTKPCGALVDEMAVWTRPLNLSEIKELYRRGANRVKFQVKSCADAACNCKSIDASGSSSDCDGDSIPNSTDTSDANLASYFGSDGTADTYFSELTNCASIDGSGNCSGSPAITAPNLTFANFPGSAQPTDNGYFQFKIYLESEENSLCTASAPCLPTIDSIDLGPSGRIYAGSPVIRSNTGISFSQLVSMAFSEQGSCTPKYQLSADGSSYFYWNGTAWASATAEQVSEASTASDINSHAGSFTDSASGSALFFKAFLPSDSTESCGLGGISVTIKE